MFDAILELIVRIMAWQRVGKPLARITKSIIITIGSAVTISAILTYLLEVSFGIWLIFHYKGVWGNGDMIWFVISATLFLSFCFYGFVHFTIEAIKTRGKTISGFSISDREDIINKLEARIKAIEDLLEDAKKNGKL